MGDVIAVRIVGRVGVGKTHVAETIRKALEAEYGGEIDISLTDINGDKNSLPELLKPSPDVGFKIVEDHKGQ